MIWLFVKEITALISNASWIIKTIEETEMYKSQTVLLRISGTADELFPTLIRHILSTVHLFVKWKNNK